MRGGGGGMILKVTSERLIFYYLFCNYLIDIVLKQVL